MYVIEHRIADSKTNENFENVLCHVSSTLEKAISWCKKNIDYEIRNEDRPWVFVISKEIIDDENIIPIEVEFITVDWDGKVLKNNGDLNGK